MVPFNPRLFVVATQMEKCSVTQMPPSSECGWPKKKKVVSVVSAYVKTVDWLS